MSTFESVYKWQILEGGRVTNAERRATVSALDDEGHKLSEAEKEANSDMLVL